MGNELKFYFMSPNINFVRTPGTGDFCSLNDHNIKQHFKYLCNKVAFLNGLPEGREDHFNRKDIFVD